MISHSHKTLFVHIPKAAGQSIELAFLEDLNLTWDERESLLLRANKNPSEGPERLAHLYAREYVQCGHISQDKFDTYFKFAVVRHPYERAISEYRYRNNWRQGPLWYFLSRSYDDTFLDTHRHMAPQVNFVYDDNGNMIVDQVIKFETLSEEITPILKKLIGPDASLPRRNTSKPSSRLFWPKELKPHHKKMIYKKYRSDFEAFGYEP